MRVSNRNKTLLYDMFRNRMDERFDMLRSVRNKQYRYLNIKK
jgi:hypothetical protein